MRPDRHGRRRCSLVQTLGMRRAVLPGRATGTTVGKKLVRKRGVSIAEICADTGWQPHTGRARITGFRKHSGLDIRCEDGRYVIA